jgi:FkbM family methyltransferase
LKTIIKTCIIRLLFFVDKIIKFTTKKSVLYFLDRTLDKFSYVQENILGHKIIFFAPNEFAKWRVKTFYIKEPDTLKWIDGFNSSENLIFWDIGANIGLYSIYNSLKNQNSKTIAFEPSSSNLRILSRNISINNLQDKIEIFQIPLSNVQNKFLLMREAQFIEGSGLNTFGANFNYEGKTIESNNDYKIFGSTINYFLRNKILDIPDHIKIDVDGIEHFILEGANEFLKEKKIKSILIEVNEDFEEQHQSIIKILSENNFKFSIKTRNVEIDNNMFSNNFNYIFIKNT